MYRRLFVSVNPFHARHVHKQTKSHVNLPGLKPGHTLGGAGRGGTGRGRAGLGEAGRGEARQNWLHSVLLDELDDCILGTSVALNNSTPPIVVPYRSADVVKLKNSPPKDQLANKS